MDIEQKYSLLIDTLNLVLLPKKTGESTYDALVNIQLEELEGDHHTFLHNNSLNTLVINGQLTRNLASSIEKIRFNISRVKSSLWNPKDFIWNNEWVDIREQVLQVITQLK